MVMAQGFTQEQVQSILDNVQGSDLIDEQTRALLMLAEKITRHSYRVIDEDIQALRDMGLKDEAILEALHITAFFNYIDRMADSTGAPVENMQAMVAGMQEQG